MKLLLIDVDRILSWFQTELPVRENIFLLLDATQTSLGGAKARFPQYYDAYYELVVGIIFSIFLSFLLCYCVENSVSVISVCRYMDQNLLPAQVILSLFGSCKIYCLTTSVTPICAAEFLSLRNLLLLPYNSKQLLWLLQCLLRYIAEAIILSCIYSLQVCNFQIVQMLLSHEQKCQSWKREHY